MLEGNGKATQRQPNTQLHVPVNNREPGALVRLTELQFCLVFSALKVL